MLPLLQAIVRPYLESKYSVLSTGRRGTGVVFKPSISFRRWMSMWMEQMVQHFASGGLHGCNAMWYGTDHARCMK